MLFGDKERRILLLELKATHPLGGVDYSTRFSPFTVYRHTHSQLSIRVTMVGGGGGDGGCGKGFFEVQELVQLIGLEFNFFGLNWRGELKQRGTSGQPLLVSTIILASWISYTRWGQGWTTGAGEGL